MSDSPSPLPPLYPAPLYTAEEHRAARAARLRRVEDARAARASALSAEVAAYRLANPWDRIRALREAKEQTAAAARALLLATIELLPGDVT